jgi:hypothetical protein
LARYRDRGFRRKPNFVFSVFLIVAGIALFLANLNLLPINVHEIWDLWPLIFVAMGLGKIGRTPSPAAFLIGGILVTFGAIFTLVNIGVIRVHIHDGSWPLSLLFIALGVGGLAKVLEGNNPRWRQPPSPNLATDPSAPSPQPPWPTRENWAGWSNPSGPNSNASPVLDNVALMASIKRKVDGPDFQGGTLTAFWGSIDLDLRRARMPEGRDSILLDTNVIMGGVKLRIPETWRVSWNGLNIMANFEDRTIPPVAGSAAPELVISGYLLMGSIEVES